MADSLVSTHTDALEVPGVAGAFAALMSVCSDAVLLLDATNCVRMCNTEATELFCAPYDELIGSSVRDLFTAAPTTLTPADLPCVLEGSSVAHAKRFDGMVPTPVAIRACRISGTCDFHMLAVRRADPAAEAERERDRVMGELYEANHRLAGTLHIVLDTLDSADVETLFGRVAEELCDVMGASGVLVYIGEGDTLRLRATTGQAAVSPRAHELPRDSGLGLVISRQRAATRLSLQAPSRETLRAGRLATRELVDEETRETYAVPAWQVPPFASELLVPVWFGGEVIAALELGWVVPHPMSAEDGRLLDAVVQYLSVQIMGAISAMRARRAEALDRAAQALHDRLAAMGEYESESWFEVFRASVEDVLSATVCAVDLDRSRNVALVDLPGNTTREIPLDSTDDVSDPRSAEGVTFLQVVPVTPNTPLSQWLFAADQPHIGAYLDTGELPSHDRWRLLVLRGPEAGRMSEMELSFLRRACEDVRNLAEGVQLREGDRRISQALQRGMRNELQQVEGIVAHGIYSSATARAFVGGDFYNLIRLPDRRACVIMGDVSGKGIEAASVSAAVRTALGAYAWAGFEPAAAVRSLNDFLLGFSRLETFATLFVGIVDLAAGRLTYCSAGHPPALLIHPNNELEMLDVQSGVVGAFQEMLYRDGTVSLSPDDRLFLYTDGTTEARNQSGAFFGEDGLRDTLVSCCCTGAEDLSASILAELDSFTGCHLEDDVALVELRFVEVGEQRSSLRSDA